MVNSLNETIELMMSSDYKDNFKAEYYQLEYRYKQLKKMLEDWNADKLSFTSACDIDIYTSQIVSMGYYLNVLRQRAEIEDVEL